MIGLIYVDKEWSNFHLEIKRMFFEMLAII